ncbi:MAG: polynucleotide adenylyltransferase PcnB [Gammaproteobacteria bacterium]|nr:polynucleotide adenylyltransferase PcnB [Gammaproteobacteria bacterium]MDP2140246.1 polynucleotide adenylyltransferase PcnB [Gammaproteobacteria bacterium]MDP2348121.1 polynucleotide adenylyltransferase PcnB [Gammaproteobacteria bacterium]
MLRKLTRVLFGKRSKAKNTAEYAPEASNSRDRDTSGPFSAGKRANLDELDLSGAEIIEREDHCISRKSISPNAVKVLYRLNDAGYHAFLVGGGVRDLLLGDTPKDFDISTNATPEEVRQLFRNAMIIGRRFKIVHLRYGREIIEVTTFRAHHEPENEFHDNTSHRSIKGLDSAHSSSGMILRDNVYGSINEDALRRDFTANALYYTIDGFRILDFANGLQDIDKRLLRIIGDPATRYREDPVRLLRAIRFAAKLNFKIEEKTRAPINELAYLLESISPARIFDETLKLFTGGHAEKTFALLRQFKVGGYLFKSTIACTQDSESPASRLLVLALRNTDSRLAEGKSVTPAFLYAALLWAPLQHELDKTLEGKPVTLLAQQDAASKVIGRQIQVTAIPKRFTISMREIWELQLRLSVRTRRAVESIFAHPKFRAGYDFLLLREEGGENLDGLGQWWTDFQNGDKTQQETMLEALGKVSTGPRRRRRKPSRKPASGAGGNA